VIDNPAEARKLAEAAFSGVYAINTFVKEAPALVTVVTQQSVLQARLGAAMRNMEYRLIDIGVACEHFVLQADEEGLGTCWLGWLNEKAVKKFLGLPRSARVHIMISVGYPGDTTRREKVRRPLDEVRRYHGSAAK
jgi:nitroreductase